VQPCLQQLQPVFMPAEDAMHAMGQGLQYHPNAGRLCKKDGCIKNWEFYQTTGQSIQ